MADWKQITARIRRARGSRDPVGQLTLLYEKTNDAMVAFELGRHFEITKDNAKALEWYLTAAVKFRRGEWKTKARDSVARLGGELPPESVLVESSSVSNVADEHPSPSVPFTIPEPAVPFEQTAVAFESLVAAGGENAPPPEAPKTNGEAPEKRHRRRGRRGGRNRRKGSAEQSASESRVSTRSAARARVVEPSEAAPAEI